MTVALICGALAGLAAVVAVQALRPTPPPLDVALKRLARRDSLAPVIATRQGTSSDFYTVLGSRLGRFLAAAVPSGRLEVSPLDSDLQQVGRTREQHLGQKIVLALVGLLLPAAIATLMVAAGTNSSLVVPVGAGVALGVIFFFVPDLTLKTEAAKRRRQFRHALGSFLDLVVISLAGGAGVESALRDAARVGQGSAYVRLRAALEAATLTGETPWASLGRLGNQLGVPELAELAASVSLAGTEGAKVRQSLAAKATSLRDHELAETEAESQSATERMAIPVVLLFLGFLVLIGYPAVDAVLTGF
jgi:Flp pilus assembly protein TadB